MTKQWNHWALPGSALITAILLATGGTSGCAPSANRDLTLSEQPNFGVDPGGWTIRQKANDPEAGVTVLQAEMPPAERAMREKEYAASALSPIPLESTFNASLFRLDGVKEYEGHLAIAPKIFAYGSRSKGKIVPKRNGDGTLTLTFSVIFTDGLSEKITAPDDESQIQVPETLRVQNESALATQLAERFGSGVKISPLPGCAKEIYVISNGTKYAANPIDMDSIQECPINRPLTVSLTLPEKDGWRLLQEELYANQAEIRAVWETRLPVPVSRVTIEIERAKLLEAIEAELGVTVGPWVDADLKLAIERATRKQVARVSIQGDVTPGIQTLIDLAMKEFSEPLGSADAAPMAGCPTKGEQKHVCVRLRYQHKEATGSFFAQWDHRTMTVKGSKYMTWGKLKPLLDRAANFTLDNKDKNWVETALTAVEGDVLEIEPQVVKMEQHSYDEADMSAHTSEQCIRSEPVFETRCHLEFQPLVNSPLCAFLPLTCLPVPKSICESVKVGDRCLESQSVRDYNRPAPEMVEVTNKGSIPQLFDGILLKFTGVSQATGTPFETTCPLSAFGRQASGDRILLRLGNSPACQPFVPGDSAPMLHLGNQIRFEYKEQHGREVRNAAGQIIESPATAVFEPRVRLSGNLSIRGAAFGNDSSHGDLLKLR